jgi:hypothetical protein
MSDPHLPERRGAHRGRRELLRAVLPSLIAVSAVVALVAGLIAWRGQPAGEDAVNTASSTAPATTPAKAAAKSPRPTAKASATAKATGEQTPEPEISPSYEPSPEDTPTSDDATLPPSRRGTQVVVLNATRRSGLASRVADRLRADGWTIATVGNFRGSVPGTTVYYPDGDSEVAGLLAEDLPGATRVKPRFANLSRNRLTVVITDNYSEQR